jgi:hypothetical protein
MPNAPLVEYRRHHDVLAPRIDSREFRPGWRRKTRLMGLVETGKIGRDELEAGLQWRRWCETIGRQRTQAWIARINQSPMPGIPAHHELAAARSLQMASAAVGPLRTSLLLWCLVDDLSWCDIGRRLRVQRQTAVKRVIEALEALAVWRAGRPVPEPPRIRFRNQPGSW